MKRDRAADEVEIFGKEPISSLQKGLGFLERTVGAEQIAEFRWNLLHEDLSLPAAVLYADRLRNNADWMQNFIATYGLKLAPHGKTTMAPKLFDLQLRTGAWGITLATAHQTLVAYRHGVRRVLMANQLIGRGNMEILAQLLKDPTFEFYCLVDSAPLVEQLGNFFANRGNQLHVLLELGVDGGRTGVRDERQLDAVLEVLQQWRDIILLSGVEVYEGVLDDDPSIRAFLWRAVAVTKRLLREKRIAIDHPVLSGAGSAWYDVVAEVFAESGLGDQVDLVLRPGCYLTHDVGIYQKAQERIQAHNPVAHRMRSALVPALEVWAYVQSVPESRRAIVGMGKRDVAFDAGLPIPKLHFRPGDSAPHQVPKAWRLTKMMDQHAYLEVGSEAELRVGDMIGFDISHPCLTFDKWRCLPIIDSKYRVIDLIRTYF